MNSRSTGSQKTSTSSGAETPKHWAVDIIKNEWLAGKQIIVATVYDIDGKLLADHSGYQAFVERLKVKSLDELYERVQGDYVFCTKPELRETVRS